MAKGKQFMVGLAPSAVELLEPFRRSWSLILKSAPNSLSWSTFFMLLALQFQEHNVPLNQLTANEQMKGIPQRGRPKASGRKNDTILDRIEDKR